MSFDEDRMLIENIIDYGNKKSFDILIEKYKNMVFNLCFRMLNNYEDSQDCAQDVFVKVFRHIKGFQFRSNFSTWLYKIAINECKNKMNSLEFRLRKKDKSKSHDEAGEKDFISQITDFSQNTSQKIEIKEENELIKKAISKLPAMKKTLIILRDIEKKSYEEISEITGMKLGTVKSKLARSRDDLKVYLKEVIK